MLPTRLPAAPSGLLALCAALAAPAAGQPIPADAALRVDAVFAAWDSTTTPGCAVAASVDGLTVLSRAYGMADLEHGIPNRTGTIFEGGSLSKQITAATVVLLALDGRLDLDGDIRRWVPEVPEYGHVITLRHLLNHTSGLRDWGSVASVSGWPREERSHTHAHALEIIARQRALNFVPGTEYSYSNTGYTLLTLAAERAGGAPLRELSERLVFAPVGMRDTQWRDDYRRIVPGRSSAYRGGPGFWEIDRPIEHVYGNGGLLTTVHDLLLWNRALDERRFGPDFHREMHRTGVLTDGSGIVYASGLRVEDFAGVPSVTHTGATAGYRAFLGRYPEQRLSVAMLCNASNVPTGGSGGAVARVLLGGAATEPPVPDGVAVPEGTLRGYAGLYREPVTGEPMEWSLEDGVLVMDGRTALIPLSATTFATGPGDTRYVVGPGEGGRPTVREEGWAHMGRTFEPVEAWTPDATFRSRVAGAWWSPEAATTLQVEDDGGHLVLRRAPDWERSLQPLYPGAFDAGGWIVRVLPGADGGDELSVSLGRVYDMRFRRDGG
ncbi:MAG: serine hydrolase domain-containing protein [Longimicrobiales bacterium]